MSKLCVLLYYSEFFIKLNFNFVRIKKEKIKNEGLRHQYGNIAFEKCVQI